MGKSRKYSKGFCYQFVLDFCHVVDTMGESKGLGSSRRVDNKLIMSKGSCATKRKCQGFESFDVPSQLWSFTKMTRYGRKDLKLRLKSELEEVRKLQKKIASMNSTTIELSLYSDIKSCSEVEKRPLVERLHSTLESSALHGEYSSLMKFATDVQLAFSNAMTYNPLEKKILAINDVSSEPSKPTTCVETKIEDQIPPVEKKKIMPNDTNVKPEPIKRIMTDEEKQKLSMELEASLAELPENIIDFLKEQSHNAGQINDDETEIDIDALSDDTLFILRKLLDDFMLEKQKTQAKAGPCEIERLRMVAPTKPVNTIVQAALVVNLALHPVVCVTAYF
ncbi:Transcription factor GTE8 [Spatholobus suberectus]|nr:Transcription factor GTE8 [Spatholobus suberectus]